MEENHYGCIKIRKSQEKQRRIYYSINKKTGKLILLEGTDYDIEKLEFDPDKNSEEIRLIKQSISLVGTIEDSEEKLDNNVKRLEELTK